MKLLFETGDCNCLLLVCRFVNTCMQLVQEGMNDEEAIEKAANTLEFNQMFARRGEETEHVST